MLKQHIKTFLKKFPRHWIVAASAWCSKIITSLVQIVSIRVLLASFGENSYAVYLVVFSLTGWFSLFEFSVGSSLQNFISESRAKKENYEKYLIASLQIITVLFIVSIFLMLIITNPVQDIIFRKFTHISFEEKVSIIFMVGIVSLINALLGIVYKIYYALHKGYIPNMMFAVSSVISMISIVIFNRFSFIHNSLLCALLIFTLPQLIITLIHFLKIFKSFFAKIFKFDFVIIKSLFTRSVKFHGMSVIYMAYIQTDYLVMSQTLSPNEIVTYNIFIRVFMFYLFLYTSMLGAFWPVSTEMYIQQKFEYIKKTIKRNLIYVTLFMIAGTAAVMIFSKFIITILAPGLDIIPVGSLILLFGIYITIKAWQDTFMIFLQSISTLKIFWIYMPFQAFINIFMQYFLSKKYGIEGIVIGLILSIILVSIWVLPLKTYKILNSKT
ncbi:MAG: MATE family efflux transporter [Endomicrobium sp.]|jgi:O-antigen/teichoic acid export membrane protein|nr:MATE family efflux transporter [Endomicrobium sp.]